MGNIFSDVTIIICLAAVFAILFRLLKQPTILAYILAGVLVGPFALFSIHNREVISNFSDFGITLLLFSLGLELKIGELKVIGRTVIFAGIAQILLTAVFGFTLALLLGFTGYKAFYIAIGVVFSSTMIVVKLLADKNDLNSLYGKISIGINILQDFFSLFLLIFLSGLSSNTSQATTLINFGIVFLKIIIIITVIINLSKYVLPPLLHIISRSTEILFLFSIAWVFGVAASIAWMGFSIEIGGFLAGLALANTFENYQIISRIRPLRDFFITIFFVFLGMQLELGNLSSILLPAVSIALFALIMKPLLMMCIMGSLGYRKRTAFFTSLNLAQISEFSLILILMGNALHQIPKSLVSLMILVGIITFIISTYLIKDNNRIYKKIGYMLRIFEWRKGKEEKAGENRNFTNHIIVVGGRRTGITVLEELAESGQVIVVDFDPDIVKKLHEKGIATIFGDIVDEEIQERIHLSSAKLVISTMTDFGNNTLLIKAVHHASRRIKIISIAYDAVEAKLLYKEGVDYVMLPYVAGSRQIAKIIKSGEFENLAELRQKDNIYLQ
ncbi:MAG TPA: cation:proton antiporter [Patescibacteria group bacterium]|nr:cation:proton antiporter [Patescibacteria group bacterium]